MSSSQPQCKIRFKTLLILRVCAHVRMGGRAVLTGEICPCGFVVFALNEA